MKGSNDFVKCRGVWLLLNFQMNSYIVNSSNHCVHFEHEGQQKPTVNIILPSEISEAFPFKFRQKTMVSTITTSIQHYFGVLGTLIRLKPQKV